MVLKLWRMGYFLVSLINTKPRVVNKASDYLLSSVCGDISAFDSSGDPDKFSWRDRVIDNFRFVLIQNYLSQPVLILLRD